MSPAFDYHSGLMPLSFQAGGRVPTIHGYSQPLEITFVIYKHSLILFQACVKMKQIMSSIFVISYAHKYMRMCLTILLSLFQTRKGYTKREPPGVIFKLVLDSLNMKILLSDLASFHTRLKGFERVSPE